MSILFSIISPSFNKVDYLELMIHSIQSQTELNWELIIIDDSSTDGSIEILEKYSKLDERIKITLNSKNRGANFCRNEGIRQAKGQFLIFFDADDLMAEDTLEKRLQAIRAAPDSDIYIFNMALFKKQIGDLPSSLNWIPPENKNRYLECFLKHKIPWSVMQSTWRKEYILGIKGFDENFLKLQDVEIHTRAIIAGAKITAFINLEADVFYRIDEQRKNFDALDFQKRSIESSIKYYEKFYPLLISNQQKKQISGTLFHALAGLCWQRRTNQISKKDYQLLRLRVEKCCKHRGHSVILRCYQNIAIILPFHLPGLKKTFEILLSI